jgi:hypothetical protein
LEHQPGGNPGTCWYSLCALVTLQRLEFLLKKGL